MCIYCEQSPSGYANLPLDYSPNDECGFYIDKIDGKFYLSFCYDKDNYDSTLKSEINFCPLCGKEL